MSVAPIRVVPATSRVDLVFNAGEDVEVALAVVDGDAAPLTISGAEAMIRAHPEDPDPLHVWSEAAGNLTHTTGQVVLIVTADNTTAWLAGWGDAEWDLEVTDGAGKTKRVAEGAVRVTPSRTH